MAGVVCRLVTMPGHVAVEYSAHLHSCVGRLCSIRCVPVVLCFGSEIAAIFAPSLLLADANFYFECLFRR